MAGNYLPYARVTTGNPQTTLDATAKNPVGSLWAPPTPYNNGTFSTTVSTSTAGLGAPPVFKYVYFYDASALTGTAQVGPAPVYWIDESFTTVTAVPADAYSFATAGVSVAGYWMPNTTALGTSNTAAQWYLQFVQAYGWIQIGGFLPGAQAPTTTTNAAIGADITGLGNSATAWGSTTANPTAPYRVLGVQWSAITGAGSTAACDVLVGGMNSFWGS